MLRGLIRAAEIVLVLSVALASCKTASQEKPGQPASVNSSSLVSLPAYPRGLIIPGMGWVPPVPPGMNPPRALTEAEWGRIEEIARTDPVVAAQIKNNNIGAAERWWIGYTGGVGNLGDEDSAVTSSSYKPLPDAWYYPAILFLFISRTDRDGQYVAVDLTTGRVVFSSNLGLPPERPFPP